jgi:hypothetical protein
MGEKLVHGVQRRLPRKCYIFDNAFCFHVSELAEPNRLPLLRHHRGWPHCILDTLAQYLPLGRTTY